MGMVVMRIFTLGMAGRPTHPGVVAAVRLPTQMRIWIVHGLPNGAGECLAVQATEAEIFYLEKLVDPVMGSFASQAGLLHAAEGNHLGGNQSGVNADHSVLESLGYAPDPSDVATKEITGETEFGVIRKLDGFVIFIESKERGNGAECFFPSHLHLRGDISEDGRLVKCAAQAMTFAP